MQRPKLQCPSCGGPVRVGDIECKHCGVNLKSGESYEARVKRTRGKLKHHEGLTGGLYIALGLAFVLLTLGGFLYQRRMHKVMRQQPQMFVPGVRELARLDRLAARGEHAVAQQQARDLAQALRDQAESIELEDLYAPREKDQWGHPVPKRTERKWDKRGGKALLLNLAAKAESKAEIFQYPEDSL